MRSFQIGLMLTGLTLFMSANLAVAQEVGSPSSGDSSGPSGGPSEIPNEGHLKCLINSLTKDQTLSEQTSKGLVAAVKAMNFKPGDFGEPALLNFLAQSMQESGLGEHMTGKQTKDYGLIQVSSANLDMVSKCMATKQGGDKCKDAKNNPDKTIGDGSKPDMFCASLASLCWWQKNMVDNQANCKYTKDTSKSSSDAISQIVNTGHVGGNMTGGTAQNCAAREKHLQVLNGADSQCRSN